MTVPQRTYTDPTLNYWQGLASLGGSDKSVRGDPGAMDALAKILQTQMGQLTPEGMAGLIKQIFEQGGKQVPVIATQYGQAVGARTGNNSSIANANANLQDQLARKSFDMILQAQGQAAQTAGVLGNLNKTESSSPSASWMQLLPFAPALLGKGGLNIAGIAKKFLDPDGADDGGAIAGQLGLSPSSSADASYGFSVGDSFSSGGGFTDYGGFDVGDAGYFGGGGDYGMGFGSDGIDLGGFDAGGSIDYVDGFDGFDLGFADGGLVSRKKIMGKANQKPKGYANGGPITGAGYGPTPGSVSNPTRGVTYSGMNPSLVPMLRAMNGGGGSNPGASAAGRSFVAPKDDDEVSASTQDNGPGVSVPSVVGTPDENAAAIAGLVGFAVATALGIPSAVPGIAMSLAGIPNSSMSPTGKSINVVQSLLSQMMQGFTSPDTDPASAPASVDGMSTVGPTGAGMSSPTGGLGISPSFAFAADDAPEGMTAASSDGTGSVGDSGGSSSGGTDGVGDAAAAGVGGGGFKKGGKIDGPGTETSDSIPILVSDNEYVLNAEATEMFLPIVEMMNAIGLEQRGGKKNGTR